MSVRTVASKFVELCRQGKNFDVMRTLYAPDIVSVEGDGKETTGQDPVIKKSEDWVSDKAFNGETVAGPFFNDANPDQFVVFFALDITPKATGKDTGDRLLNQPPSWRRVLHRKRPQRPY